MTRTFWGICIQESNHNAALAAYNLRTSVQTRFSNNINPQAEHFQKNLLKSRFPKAVLVDHAQIPESRRDAHQSNRNHRNQYGWIDRLMAEKEKESDYGDKDDQEEGHGC
ncbi:hypothetical protein RRG08_034942 [Elysia crispata]|uniref:Uncharacterized protein n=1 Tax=Elysia crispata TaxID=231223 RepID=A0AAE0Y2Y9_9GAST|nr:hypothetical protein RRG08_034942 [Elysia crispata]